MTSPIDETDPREQSLLFDHASAPTPIEALPRRVRRAGAARLLYADRHQVELRACDLDALLGADHPARSVWAFVQVLDLQPLYAQVKSVEGSAGAPAIDPAILMALWLWATVDGVGSAREIDRLCERDDTYRWLCGGVGVNHHTLADFRTVHAAWLDAQLTRSIAALMERSLVTLDVVAQDGLRVRAHAKASSFRRKDRLAQLHALALEQVAALKQEIDADAGASARRKHEARERAARERLQGIQRALQTFEEIDREATAKAQDKARSRAVRSRADRDEDDTSGPGGPCAPAPAPAPVPAPAHPSSKSKPKGPSRVSATDPEARVMKMADGGFRPAYNVQFLVDEATQLIAGLDVVNEGSDMHALLPMHSQIEQRYGHTPAHWLADGGYPKYDALEALSRRGTQPVVPPARGRTGATDPLAPKATDSALLAAWRALMASPQGQALYKRRAASVECMNAQLRRRGLYRINVVGRAKARAVMLWHALAHNLMRMRSLGIAFAA